MPKSGFSLIELMVAIAILAILAGMAIVPYNYYQRKAKAKELIIFSRACLNEAISQCIENSNFNDFESLSSCNPQIQETTYLENIQITPSGSCNNEINVTASGKIKGTDITFSVTCFYNHSNDEVFCNQPISM